jgi:CrcB protein
MWERVLLIAFAGGLGSISRYGLEGLVDDKLGPTVLGTFIVNVTGALALGLFVGVTEERFMLPALARPAIAIGFLGGYTTFSTLMFETIDLAESGSYLTAALNASGSVAGGLAAMYAGLTLGRLA